MSTNITRRNFLKLTGVGAAAVLTGCGPAARYVTRKAYYSMPEYGKIGQSTYYATTCRECPAGCGILMRTMEGRAIKAEGNPDHPVSQGKICSRGLTAVQGLYNPDRVTAPIKRSQRGETATQEITWDDAVAVVAAALEGGSSTAILLGVGPDHLFDLAGEIAQATGVPAPVRYNAAATLDGRNTLLAAVESTFGQAAFPYFDLANADLVFTFGADFLSQWLSPVSYGKAFGAFRRFSKLKKRGYLVSFAPRMDVTTGIADEWVPVVPGSEGIAAQAIAALVSELRGEAGSADVAAAVQATGVSEERLHELAQLFVEAQSPLAIPGGSALGHANGQAAAEAVLALNASRLNLPGGISLTPAQPLGSASTAQAGFAQVQDLVSKMKNGQVKTLLINGANPLFELPAALDFAGALENVPTVISFASFPDETALQSDYVLPDHTWLESFGYQVNLPGTTASVVSAIQPVVAPLYNTRATADVLIAAANQAGAALNYTDEVAFIQTRLTPLLGETGGSVSAPTTETFWAQFLQKGGWWMKAAEGESAAAPTASMAKLSAGSLVQPTDENTFHLITYTSLLGDGAGANRPWLQETPNPMTTVTWNSWVEINPETAHRLGIAHDDVVKVKSAAGEIEAPAYLYPAIRPDTVAIPFGQGHTALGRFAEGRGVNPMTLVEVKPNEAGDLAYGDTLVTIEKTGRRRPLARMESLKGVYGEH